MTIDIKFYDEAFQELRTCPGAYTLLEPHAQRMVTEANAVPSTTEPAATEPYYETHRGGFGDNSDRARIQVQTTSDRAAKHEAKTHALQKALGGGSSVLHRAETSAKSSPEAKPSKKGRWTAEEFGLIARGGLSVAEIAAQTGRSEGAVRAQFSRLRG